MCLGSRSSGAPRSYGPGRIASSSRPQSHPRGTHKLDRAAPSPSCALRKILGQLRTRRVRRGLPAPGRLPVPCNPIRRAPSPRTRRPVVPHVDLARLRRRAERREPGCALKDRRAWLAHLGASRERHGGVRGSAALFVGRSSNQRLLLQVGNSAPKVAPLSDAVYSLAPAWANTICLMQPARSGA